MMMKNMKKDTAEINSAQRKSSIRLRDKTIPIEPTVRTTVAKANGNLLNFLFLLPSFEFHALNQFLELL